MAYKDIINNICNTIHTGLIDFNEPCSEASMPTLASSEFITNKQQGDWAEDVLFRAINDNSENIVAVRYGKSDDLVAGDAGFEKFFNEYQAELDTIGKRPDILLFKKEVFDASLGYDISSKPSNEIGDYVAKAIAGIEVRSSDQCWSIGDVKELPTMLTKETSKEKSAIHVLKVERLQ